MASRKTKVAVRRRQPDTRVPLTQTRIAELEAAARDAAKFKAQYEAWHALAGERAATIADLQAKVVKLEFPVRHPLELAFLDALAQAKTGKGRERHAMGLPFMEQPWVLHARQHGIGFLTGQAAKKIGEAAALNGEEYDREVLGGIVYAAMAIIYRRTILAPIALAA